ncbi:hypothetical protein QO010_001982 [Caulobacter ginsengisoli]|uniref:Uncharacterized protein n=1 Tax=Caulobacter ginsengisoli TaxID=400775 RepID=A0ABU0IQB4_9CAUL|nr:hypothetical protein [Caulobacter ginsengisoli]
MDPGGAAHSADYFSEDAIALDRAKLVAMGDASTIQRVAR